MKKNLLFLLALSFGLLTFAQQRLSIPQAARNMKVTRTDAAVTESVNPLSAVMVTDAPLLAFPEDVAGTTIYDLQSNASSPYGRVIRFDDGTFSAVWTRGMAATAYADRGTGYNYFDGTSWGADPSARIETVKTGWPSVARMGLNGEAVVSHVSGTVGLKFSKRDTKGTGAWVASTIAPPPGSSGLLWPRMVSGGTDYNTLHVIALTAPTANGGTVFQGQDGALVYTKSTDNGTTWSTPVVLPGLGSTNYFAFGGDSYDFAEPQGNNVAFSLVDNSNDMVIMKSADNGATWTKTVVWANPYPMLDPATTSTDTMYAPDATVGLAFDKNGKIHAAFGVYRLQFDGAGSYSYYPGLSGIAYWNEDMPTFTGGDQLNILNPDSLDAQGKLIGTYLVDWNNNGTLDLLYAYGAYGTGWASFPQLAFDENNNAIFIFSSLTEGFNDGTKDYRHIWCRASSDNGANWGQIIDLDDDPIHMFDECLYPSVCANSDAESWYFTYHFDNVPGGSVRGDLTEPTTNTCSFYHLSKIVNSISDPSASSVSISANYPNPVTEATTIDVTLAKSAPVSIAVVNVTGQKMSNTDYGMQSAGVHSLVIDGSKLSAGVYFYTVSAGQQKITRKMVVK
jgi:hypothetical protein